MTSARLALVSLSVLLATTSVACSSPRMTRCTTNSDCSSRQFCSAGMCLNGCTSDESCVATAGPGATCNTFGMCIGVDAGARDGGSDASVDASVVDADLFDAGTMDDASIDLDAGMDVDAWMDVDAGTIDGGVPIDAPMSVDAGSDAGRIDSGTSSDAGRPVDAGSSVLAQIEAVRAAPVGDFIPALPVTGATVTYVVPAIGTDPGGFFVQGAPTGPALFVAVEPAVLTPGDVVSFDVLTTARSGGQHRVTALAAFSLVSSGFLPSSFTQDVSAVDLVAQLDGYESELVSADLVLATDVTGACGAGHVCAQATTLGVPTASTMLRFRTLPSVVSARGLRSGCSVHVGPTPLWRNNLDAQPSAFVASEVTVTSCPAFHLLSATATSSNSVLLTFDAPIDPISVMEASFTFTGGVTTGSLSFSGNTVTLTTTTLSAGATYTVTVASTTRDTSGATIDPVMRSATFSYASCSSSHLVINEVDYDQVGTDVEEWVEIHNPTSSSVSLAGYSLVLVNGSGGLTYTVVDLSVAGTLPAGGYLVVTSAGIATPPSALRIAWASTAGNVVQNGAPDGVALVSGSTLIDALSYEGSITAATVTGIAGTVSLVEGIALDAAVADSNTVPASLARVPSGCDTDNASVDWVLSTSPTPGAAN